VLLLAFVHDNLPASLLRLSWLSWLSWLSSVI